MGSTWLIAWRVHGNTYSFLLNMLAKYAQLAKIYYLWRPQLRDPNDDMILELAISSHADAIITFNQRDFLAARSVLKNIQLWTPSDYYKNYLQKRLL